MVAIRAAGCGLEQMSKSGRATTWAVLPNVCQDAHVYMTMHMQQNEVVAFTLYRLTPCYSLNRLITSYVKKGVVATMQPETLLPSSKHCRHLVQKAVSAPHQRCGHIMCQQHSVPIPDKMCNHVETHTAYICARCDQQMSVLYADICEDLSSSKTLVCYHEMH